MAEIVITLSKEELIALTNELKKAPAVPVQELQRIEDNKELVQRIKGEFLKVMKYNNGSADSLHTLIGI